MKPRTILACEDGVGATERQQVAVERVRLRMQLPLREDEFALSESRGVSRIRQLLSTCSPVFIGSEFGDTFGR